MLSEAKRLVVTGSSAGGIESLSRLITPLGKDFPCPIVVAQHLNPGIPSHLADILGARTVLNVVSVEDSVEMQPGTIYVVPANRDVEVLGSRVAIRADGKPHPRPSVDRLFASAAQAYGDRVIAIVLSGLGNDGSAGARAVKSAGGTVIIEDPQSAGFPSMPGSLPSSMVDIVAPAERIGSELETLLNEDLAVADDDTSLATLLKRVHVTSGIDFTHYKMPTIKRRLARQVKAAGLSSLADYLKHIEESPSEYERMVSAFLIKVTGFFRDPELFTWLKVNAIADIIAEARKNGKEIRLWSAGCATGEEAYSLAIAFAEVLGKEIRDFSIRLFATDIDEVSISFARHGVYPAHAFTNVPPEILDRYFTPVHDEKYEISPAIRDMAVFGQHDLGRRPPFARIDLVLCRNVLIYFTKELQERAIQLFAFALRNGGYMVLGKAETSSPLPTSFEAADAGLRVFRRYGERVSIPPTPPARIDLRAVRTERCFSPGGELRVWQKAQYGENEEIGSFLMASSIGFVSVDEHYDIGKINLAARRQLNILGIGVGDDLIHMLPGDAALGMRTLVDTALRSDERKGGSDEIEVAGAEEGEARILAVSCYPKIGANNAVVGAVLLIVDVTHLAKGRRRAEQIARDQTDELRRLREQERLERGRRRELIEVNEKLTLANAELRVRADALIMGTEEAAAITEDLETLNEEMQAGNEELETLNEEYQATIEELNVSQAELETRCGELQELLVAREAERREALESRATLQAMVDSVAQPLAAVASNGTILATNRPFGELQRCGDAVTVRVEGNSNGTNDLPGLLRRAAAGEGFRFSAHVAAANQLPVDYRGTVTPRNGDPVSGAIVVLEKIE